MGGKIARRKGVWNGLMLVILALVGLWWGLSMLTGDTLTPVRWANYATPWISMGLLIAGAGFFAAGSKNWGLAYLLVGLMVLGPYGSQLTGGLGGFVQKMEPTDNVLRVVSFNLMTRNVDTNAVAAVILHNQADLIFLQEVRDPELLATRISNMYGDAPTYIATDDRLNLMIVSRFPVLEEPSEGKIQRAVVKAPQGNIVLRNLHSVKGIRSDAMQQKLIAGLSEEVSRMAAPIIVAGDFNLTQDNDGYRELRTWLFNAHEEAGSGFGFTFPTPSRRVGWLFPFVRIDHLFVSRHFAVLSSSTVKDYGNSDHFPIEMEVIQR